MTSPDAPPPQRVFPPSPEYRQVEVPPLGCGGIVASLAATEQEAADFDFVRAHYQDTLIPWDERPDLRTVDDVLGYLQRRSLRRPEALALKRQMLADLVERSRGYKFGLLDRALEQSRFWEALDRRHTESGKAKAEFSVLIKPNTMMVWSRYEVDPANATDPELVLHLVDRLHERGFTNVVVAEAQNVYSHWFHAGDPDRGRSAIDVYGWEGTGYPIDRQGHSIDQHGRRDGRFRVVDLTLDSEGHTHNFGEDIVFIPRTSPRRYLNRFIPCARRACLGEHPLSPTLRDADFRISFPVNKTHTSCWNTLTLKNVYGCLPYADKFLEYHCKLDFDWPTMVWLRELPFHFGIVDAIFSADGVLGFKADYFPRMTRTIIAGEDLIAVDIVGSLKMSMDPLRSRMVWLAAQVFGFPVDRTQWLAEDKSPYPYWINIPRRYDWVQYWGENWYWISTYLGQATSEMDPHFTARPSLAYEQAKSGQRFFRRIVRPVLNGLEGLGRKRAFGWLWRVPDKPERLRRRYPGLYE